MSRYLALRDRRLKGGVPARNGLSIVNADAATSLSSVFGQIKGALGPHEKFSAMFILCHGFAGSNARAGVCTDAGNEGTQADGRYLMGALAIHTKAMVYAADRIQWYSKHNDLANGRFEFGDWEGQLWQFPPNGNPPSVVPCAPVEFADVMSGAAA